jgi:hypothetical protein
MRGCRTDGHQPRRITAVAGDSHALTNVLTAELRGTRQTTTRRENRRFAGIFDDAGGGTRTPTTCGHEDLNPVARLPIASIPC